MFSNYQRILKVGSYAISVALCSAVVSGCIIQVPAKSPQTQANGVLTPELMQAYQEIPKARSKGERSIADDGIPLPQQIQQIEAFLNDPASFRGEDSEDSAVTREIEAQMKLKKLQKDLDDLNDFDI